MLGMVAQSWLQQVRSTLASGETRPRAVAEQALSHANGNASRNTYLALDSQRVLREAHDLPARFPGARKPLLYGLPVSLKDCFDLAGFPTTCGSCFYAERNGISQQDSAVADTLRAQGAVIIGKTHLHPLAYGITGENPDYGDCVQPKSPKRLTGGSSSGAAASVQEGSAVAAIGTDTGGSIRVPAALCGVAGYRASIGLAREHGLWRGAVHLAPSFDTLGWLFGDLRDGPLLAEGLFGVSATLEARTSVHIGCPSLQFLYDCEPPVLADFTEWQRKLRHCGAEIISIDCSYWDEALSIYAPIQAHEAAEIHAARTGGDFSHFPKPIAERLAWGATISTREIENLRMKHADFIHRMDALFGKYDFLMLPCAPVAALAAGVDHTQTRAKILRYTTPMSLAGTPVVTVPGADGAAMQLAAARGADGKLLAYAAEFWKLP